MWLKDYLKCESGKSFSNGVQEENKGLKIIMCPLLSILDDLVVNVYISNV